MRESDNNCESTRHQYDWSNTSPTEAVIDAVASLEGVKPVALSTQLNITLYDHINPEALDALVTDDNSPTISFMIHNYTVRIDGDALTVCCD